MMLHCNNLLLTKIAVEYLVFAYQISAGRGNFAAQISDCSVRWGGEIGTDR